MLWLIVVVKDIYNIVISLSMPQSLERLARLRELLNLLLNDSAQIVAPLLILNVLETFLLDSIDPLSVLQYLPLCLQSNPPYLS
jgi:hypothetical protein